MNPQNCRFKIRLALAVRKQQKQRKQEFGGASWIVRCFLAMTGLVLAMTASPLFAWGQSRASRGEGAQIATGFSSSRLSVAKEAKESAPWFSLGLSQNYETLVNGVASEEGLADTSLIGGAISFGGKADLDDQFRIEGQLRAAGAFAVAVDDYATWEVPEAYVGGSMGERRRSGLQRLRVGRVLENWNELDSEWLLGQWQPLNRFDPLRPTEQGLTGVFGSWSQGAFEILAFASPLYLPEQGVPYDHDGSQGTITSKSPWFSTLPTTLTFGDSLTPTPIHYRLNLPSNSSIVKQESFGISFRFGEFSASRFLRRSKSTGFFGQASYVRKPRNQLALPFSAHMQIHSEEEPYVPVTVVPRVVNHELYGMDLGYKARGWALGISALVDQSVDEEFGPEQHYQILETLTMLSPHVEARLFAARSWGPLVRISYLHSFGGETRVVGPETEDDDLFGPRVLFKQALSISAKTRLVRRDGWHLDHSLRWIEEVLEEGTLVINELTLSVARNWRFALAADLLGSRKPIDETDTFLSLHRGNDRFSGRVMYAF